MLSAVFKFNLKRWWWVSALNILILVWNALSPDWDLLFAMFVCAVLSALMGWAMFSFMHSPRAAGFMGSLPLKRGDVFWGNFLSGLAMIFAAALTVSVIVQLKGLDIRSYTLGWNTYEGALFEFVFTRYLTYGLNAFAFAAMVSMITGSAAAAAVLTLVFAGLPAFMGEIIQRFCEELVYGYYSYTDTGVISVYFDYYDQAKIPLNWAVTALFLLLARWAYQKRPVQCAGEIAAFRWGRPVFIHAAAQCANMVVCAYLMIDGGIHPAAGLVAGLLTAAVVMMLIQKTPRIKGYIGQACIFIGLTAVLFCGFRLWSVWYEKRMPNPEKVESVQIYRNIKDKIFCSEVEVFIDLSQPESISTAFETHQKIIADKPVGWESFTLVYKLKNGREFKRHYSVDVDYIKNMYMTTEYKHKEFCLYEPWGSIKVRTLGLSNPKLSGVVMRTTVISDERVTELRNALAEDIEECGFDELYNLENTYKTEGFDCYSVYTPESGSLHIGTVTVTSGMPKSYALLTQYIAEQNFTEMEADYVQGDIQIKS